MWSGRPDWWTTRGSAGKLYFIQKSCGAVPGPMDCFSHPCGASKPARAYAPACENGEKLPPMAPQPSQSGKRWTGPVLKTARTPLPKTNAWFWWHDQFCIKRWNRWSCHQSAFIDSPVFPAENLGCWITDQSPGKLYLPPVSRGRKDQKRPAWFIDKAERRYLKMPVIWLKTWSRPLDNTMDYFIEIIGWVGAKLLMVGAYFPEHQRKVASSV